MPSRIPLIFNTGTNRIEEIVTSDTLDLSGTPLNTPFIMASGSLLGTPTAGAVEYDGNVIYTTPNAVGRSLSPSMLYYRLNSDLVGANVNTVQKTFGVGVNVASATVYAFEYLIYLSNSSSLSSHSININFGGTATFNNAVHSVLTTTSNTGGLVSALVSSTTMTGNLTYSTGAVTGIGSVWIGKGTCSVNAGGTLIPQYRLSVAPGGAYTTAAGSYILLYPISAAGSNTSIGNWT